MCVLEWILIKRPFIRFFSSYINLMNPTKWNIIFGGRCSPCVSSSISTVAKCEQNCGATCDIVIVNIGDAIYLLIDDTTHVWMHKLNREKQ